MGMATPPPSEPAREGVGGERRNEHETGLTARERQAFEEIEQRLRGDLDPTPPSRAPILWLSLIVVGSAVGVIGLVVVDSVAVSFAGFVVVVFGVERFTQTRTLHRWRRLVEHRTGLRARDQQMP